MNASEEQQNKTELKKGIRNYFSNLFDIRGDMMSHEEIDVMMQENTVIHGSNMWILILAMLIASIGLYNSLKRRGHHVGRYPFAFSVLRYPA